MDLKSLLARVTGRKSDTGTPPSDRSESRRSQEADQRHYMRSRIKCPVQLGVHDASGREVTVEGRGVDFSSAGAEVLSPAPIAVGAVVSFQCKELQLMGHATVRHCTKQKSKFLIGLEFRGSLTRTF